MPGIQCGVTKPLSQIVLIIPLLLRSSLSFQTKLFFAFRLGALLLTLPLSSLLCK